MDLRSNELADAPLQRNGILNGATVNIDVRKGTNVANVESLINSTERPIEERLSVGGEVNIQSSGDVILNPGSKIDISGGAVAYREGYVDSTTLTDLNGNVVNIADADPNQLYTKVDNILVVEDFKWGVTREFVGYGGGAIFSPAYVEGKDAGSLNILASNAVLSGEIDGSSLIPVV